MFFTKSEGLGGRLRQRISDFVVEEIPLRKGEDGEYTVFWMEKFNWDTHLALRAVAKKLHVSAKRFGIAGTKDKRALTRQRISVWDPKNEFVERLKELTIKDIKLYGFERGGKIRLGNLKGNKFIITIRDIDMPEEEIRRRLADVFAELSSGIPNLYGPQRFGDVRALTHLVGREMLKGNFESAVQLYLCKIFDKEPDDSKKARKFLSDNWSDPEAYPQALSNFPMRLKYERSMLDYLIKYPKDYAGALRRLPKRLRKMFLNAVQAEIFNKVVEELWGESKEKVIKNQTIPLVGFNTILSEKNKIHKRIIAIMNGIDISQKDFLMKNMPELRCSGSERDLLLKPKNMEIIKVFDDEYNEGKEAAQIAFKLPAGAYATVVLKEIMKSERVEE